MIGLLRLLRDHADAVEADLGRFYGLDLLDLWRRPRRLTYRQVLVRVRHLPAESAVAGILRDGKPAWRLEHELADAIRQRIDAHRGVKVEDIKPHPLSPAHEAATTLTREMEAHLADVADRASKQNGGDR